MNSLPKETYYIGDLSRQLCISQRTIRYYEERGLIHPLRSSGGFRLYAKDEVLRLKTILLLKDLGLSLDEIATLTKVRHQGVPSESTPMLKSMLEKRMAHFKEMIQKYRMGVEQLQEVLALLNRCTTCGQPAEEETCRHCLEQQGVDMPPLLKTIL